MDIVRLKQFLLEANEKGYAGGDESSWVTEPDGSTTISYKSNGFRSHDNFFGGEPYGGRQVVFFQNKPVWIMVYYGAVSALFDDPNQVYAFLRAALSAGSPRDVIRGPKKYAEGRYRYSNSSNGDLNSYSGKEQIYCNSKEIYWGKYIGGLVDQRKGI